MDKKARNENFSSEKIKKIRNGNSDLNNKIKKIKDSRIKPWRYLLSVIVFICSIMVFPFTIIGSNSTLNILAWFYLMISAAAVIIDIIQGNIPLHLKSIVFAYIGYIFKLFTEVILIALSIPILALMFFFGPFMAFVFLISLGGLIFYTIEVILGIDIKGMTVRHPWWVALLEIAAIIISGTTFFYILKKEDGLIERYLDWAAALYTSIVNLGRKPMFQNKDDGIPTQGL